MKVENVSVLKGTTHDPTVNKEVALTGKKLKPCLLLLPHYQLMDKC